MAIKGLTRGDTGGSKYKMAAPPWQKQVPYTNTAHGSGSSYIPPSPLRQTSVPLAFGDPSAGRGMYAPLSGGNTASQGTPYLSPAGVTTYQGGSSTPGATQASAHSGPYGFQLAGDPSSGSIGQYGYTPEGMASIYDNPAILAQDILQAMGINNPGLAQSLADYFGPALAAHFLQSGGGVGSSGSDASSLSGVNDYLQQYVTPNGQVPGFSDLASILLDAASDPNSLINQYLMGNPKSSSRGGQTGEQINNLNQLLGQALAGSNSYTQEAYRNFLNDQATNYQSGLTKGAPGGSSYADYITKSQLPSWVRGR